MYLPPSPQTGYDTRSVFKRSTGSLNSEYSFFWTGCCLNNYLAIVRGGGRENRWIYNFPKGIRLKWSTNSFVQNLDSSY